MTTRERFVGVLTGQTVDRLPFIRLFGGDNYALEPWLADFPNLGLYMDELLGFEGGYRGWRTLTMVDYGLHGLPPTRVERESDDCLWLRTGSGELIRHYKHGDYHNCTLEFPLKEAADWERLRGFVVNTAQARLPRDLSALGDVYAKRDYPLQLTCGGVYGFVRRLAGDEGLGYLLYDDPALVQTVITEYVDMLLALWERLCAVIHFDLIESWEDMAYKCGSLLSRTHFDTFLAPQYRRIRAFADAHDIPILLVDSDGYTDELAGWMYAAGVNAIYPFEVTAGCNPAAFRAALPDMAGLGGLDKTRMAGSRADMDAELERVGRLIALGRFIPGPDHMVLENVPFENYRYFMGRLREIICAGR